MMKKYLFASLVMIFSVFLFSQSLQAAEPTTLYNIRLGQHSGFTRLVFDSGGARPLKIGPATAESVTIVYTQIGFERSPSRLFGDLKGAVAGVNHQQAIEARGYPGTCGQTLPDSLKEFIIQWSLNLSM